MLQNPSASVKVYFYEKIFFTSDSELEASNT